MASDIEIAQAATPKPITEIAQALNIPDEALEPYGRIKGKVSLDWLLERPVRENARMILVTAVSPTPAGEGRRSTGSGVAWTSRRPRITPMRAAWSVKASVRAGGNSTFSAHGAT